MNYKRETIRACLEEFSMQVVDRDEFVERLAQALELEEEYTAQQETAIVYESQVALKKRITELERMVEIAESSLDVRITSNGILKPCIGLGGRKNYVEGGLR